MKPCNMTFKGLFKDNGAKLYMAQIYLCILKSLHKFDPD